MDSIGKGGAAAAAHVLTGHSELIRSLVITPDGTAAMTGWCTTTALHAGFTCGGGWVKGCEGEGEACSWRET